MMLPAVLTLSALQTAYANGASPSDLVEEIIARIEASTDPAIFISVAAYADVRAEARALPGRKAEGLPLYGLPGLCLYTPRRCCGRGPGLGTS